MGEHPALVATVGLCVHRTSLWAGLTLLLGFARATPSVWSPPALQCYLRVARPLGLHATPQGSPDSFSLGSESDQMSALPEFEVPEGRPTSALTTTVSLPGAQPAAWPNNHMNE